MFIQKINLKTLKLVSTFMLIDQFPWITEVYKMLNLLIYLSVVSFAGFTAW